MEDIMTITLLEMSITIRSCITNVCDHLKPRLEGKLEIRLEVEISLVVYSKDYLGLRLNLKIKKAKARMKMIVCRTLRIENKGRYTSKYNTNFMLMLNIVNSK